MIFTKRQPIELHRAGTTAALTASGILEWSSGNNLDKIMARTPEDYVNDMLSRKHNWWSILSVARCIRNGLWYERVKTILQEKKIMPTDLDEIEQVFKNVRLGFRDSEREKNEPKHHRREK